MSRERDTFAFLAQLERQAAAADARGLAIDAATQEAFRWARVDRRNQHYQPLGRSGDSAIAESHDLMHRRVRDQALNNAQVSRAAQALVDLVIGPGMATFADPFDPWLDLVNFDSGDFDQDLRYMLEADDLHEEWFSDPRQFDAEGKLSGQEMQRLALRECVTVGDALVLRVQRQGPGRLIPLCYQMLEREQLDCSLDRPAGPGQNKIVNGIELDAAGREVAFHVFEAHPDDVYADLGGATHSTRIPAERVLHLFLFHRPSQSVGMTWLHAIGQNVWDRDRFVAAEIQTAAKAALLALIFKRQHPGQGSLGLDDDEDAADPYGNEQVKLGSSTLAAQVGPEEDVKIVESSRPNPQAEPFLRILDHDTAAAAGVSYSTLTGRWEESTFSSARAAKLAEDLYVRPLQGWFARHWAIPQRREAARQMIGLGLLSSLDLAAYKSSPRKYERFEALPAGREFIDPEGEAEATIAKLRSGQTSLKREAAARGLHWIRLLLQIAMENRVIDKLGIAIDFTKGQGGQREGNTRTAPAKRQEATR